MKKGRLLITISDIHSSKSFSINKIIRKVILWTVLTIILFFTISLLTISKLTSIVNELSYEKDKLRHQNIAYSEQIELKIEKMAELGMQLEEIEDIIGINKDDDTTLIQRATLAKLTSSEKIYMLQTIPSECPLPSCVKTSKFGWRIHPITNKKTFHSGLDLRARIKTEVQATADGVVRYVQDKNEGTYGRVVMIAHNFGFDTTYAHLRHVSVKVGDIVNKGQLIGESGNSGSSNGPHLHYEIRHASKVLDPTSFTRWNMKNYEMIFNKQRRVECESLIKLIKNQKNKLVQL